MKTKLCSINQFNLYSIEQAHGLLNISLSEYYSKCSNLCPSKVIEWKNDQLQHKKQKQVNLSNFDRDNLIESSQTPSGLHVFHEVSKQ